MFKNISWSDYGLFVLITVSVYYSIICVLYYLNEIKQIFDAKSSMLSKLNPSKEIATRKIMQQQPKRLNREGFALRSENTLHPLVDHCMSNIKDTLQYASDNNLVKQEIIFSLQQLISKYSSIRDASFESIITNYILIECANHCSIYFDEDELKEIWVNQK